MAHLSSVNGFTQWFLLFIGLFWFGGVGLMSLAGGWHRLASRFRAPSRTEGERFRFATVYIRSGRLPVSYVNCLFVTVSPAGVRLSVLSLLRFLHPPLFVPWSAVSTVQSEALSSAMYTAMYLRDLDTRLLFTQPVAKKLLEAFNTRYSVMPA